MLYTPSNLNKLVEIVNLLIIAGNSPSINAVINAWRTVTKKATVSNIMKPHLKNLFMP